MDIYVDVIGQKLKIATNQKRFVVGTQNFIRFVFDLSGDWISLTSFAQFKQNGNPYNQTLDSENAVFLPKEIKAGEFTLALQGTNASKIAKTFEISLLAIKDPFAADNESGGSDGNHGGNPGGDTGNDSPSIPTTIEVATVEEVITYLSTQS